MRESFGGRNDNPVRLVWFICLVGLLAGCVMLSTMAFTRKDLRQTQQRYYEMKSDLAEATVRFENTLSIMNLTIARFFDGKPELAQPTIQDDLRLTKRSYEQVLSSSETEAAFKELDVQTERFITLFQNTHQWAREQQAIESRLPTISRQVSSGLNKIRRTIHGENGRQRLNRAILVHDYHQADSDEADVIAHLLMVDLSTSTSWEALNQDIQDLSLLAERLQTESSQDLLISIKDNQLLSTLSRLRNSYIFAQVEDWLPGENLPVNLLTDVETALFGSDYHLDHAHQTIIPGRDGLFPIRMRQITLNDRKEALRRDLTEISASIEASIRTIDLEAAHQVRHMEIYTEKELDRAWKVMLGIWLAAMTLFLVISLRIIKVFKAKQSQLIHAGRLASLGEMATAMAHEINQPLNIIAILVNSWSLLKKRGRLEIDKVLKDIDKINAQVNRVVKIIDHVRQFGHSASEVEDVRLSKVAQEACGLCRMQFKSRAITLKEQYEQGLPSVRAVPSQLEQVVLNLLSNARHAIEEVNSSHPRATEVTVSVTRKGDTICLSVSDNGPGIPPQHEANIFEPFFTTKSSTKGTGLGLSISKQIIEKFHGTLTFHNRPGQGATFEVHLPIPS